MNDLEGYLRYGDQVLYFDFPQMDLKPRVPGLIPRDYSQIEPTKSVTDLSPAEEPVTPLVNGDAEVKLDQKPKNEPKKIRRKGAQILEIRLPQMAEDEGPEQSQEPIHEPTPGSFF